MRWIDRTGMRYGRLVAVSALKFRGGRSVWICRCDCGNTVQVIPGNLTSGNSTSCGCATLERHTKHNDCGSSEYNTWIQMNGRCSNPNAQEYANYGGRGILVCDRWNPKKTDTAYRNFLEDMGRRPYKSASLDRIDNNGDYTPANCQWADKKFQRLNQRARVRWYSHEGKTLCMSDWAREKQVSLNALRARLNKGLSLPDALANINSTFVTRRFLSLS